MSKRLLILLVLCLALLAPAHAGASHELPHVEPYAEAVTRLAANALPAQWGGWLHIDRVAQTWTMDCQSPFNPWQPEFCPFTLSGSLHDDGHYGPISDPGCSIPAGRDGTGKSYLGQLSIPPAGVIVPGEPLDLDDARFTRTPLPGAGPIPPRGALVVEGRWTDRHGRADRFEAVFHVGVVGPAGPSAPDPCAASTVHFVFSGWVAFVGVLR